MSDTTCGTAVKENRRFDVSLEQKTCSCRRYQDTGVPCGHACAVIRAIGKAPRDFMPDYLTRHHWVNTYSKNMRPLDQASIVRLKKDHEEKMKSITEASPAIHPFTNVSPDDSDSESEDSDDSKSDAGLGPEIAQCEPPLTKVPRGRPTKKRKRRRYTPTQNEASQHSRPASRTSIEDTTALLTLQ